MIEQLTGIHQKNAKKLQEALEDFEGSYLDLVRLTVRFLSEYGADLNPLQVVEVECQGTYVYVIGTGVLTSRHFVVKVSYGSCSVCDALKGAFMQDEPKRTKALFALATHIIQGIKEI